MRLLLAALLGVSLAASGQTPDAAALAGWDDETGLWFPPDAPRQTYLDRSDREHPLVGDVRKAFEKDPALAEAVAALLRDPRHEPNYARLPDSVKQLKTMFDMVVVGFLSSRANKAQQDESWASTEKKYETWMNLEGARALSLDERRTEWNRLSAEASTTREPEGRDRAAFGMLGLSPQGDLSIFQVLTWMPFAKTLVEPRFVGFLRRVMDREGADGRPEAWRWRMALRNFHYYRGELQEARTLSHRLLGVEDLAIWENDNRLFAGLIDRLSGDPAPLAAALAGCEDVMSCRSIVHALGKRLLDARHKEAPAALAGVFEEDAASAPGDFAARLDCIRHIEVLDAARARGLAVEVLKIPATIAPLTARLDALAVTGRTSKELKDYSGAQSAWDRTLGLLHYVPPKLPAGAWARVADVKGWENGDRAQDAEEGWLQISYALQKKSEAAIAAKDFPLARRSIEALAAAAFAYQDESTKNPDGFFDLVNLEELAEEEKSQVKELLERERSRVAVTARDQLREVRSLLRQLGEAYVEAGRTAEARRVAGYLAAGPDKESALIGTLLPMYIQAKEKGAPIPPAPSPWLEAAPR
jgi:hypothetical protein